MKNRKTVRAFFTDIETLSSDDIAKLETLKLLLSENVPSSIERSYRSNQSYASIFEINMSENYLEIPKSQWVKALETIISWYSDESVQDYEKCAEISKLIASIKEDKRKEKASKTSKKKTSGKE
jgi:hypothetical protein